MARLNRFDVIEHSGGLLVVIESDLLPEDSSVVIIPLIPKYPSIRHLNPEILFQGKRFVLATRLIGPVLRSHTHYVGNISNQGDKITRAVDVLMGGF